MTPAQSGMEAGAGGHVFERLRTWWRRRTELDRMDRDELARLAEDVGVTAAELRDLEARGPHASDLLYERMHALGLGKADVDALAPGVLRDLERTCSQCLDKGVCQRDLAIRPDDPAWAGYCPNAEALTCVKIAKEHLPAQPQ